MTKTPIESSRTLKQLSKSLADLQDEYDKIPSKPDRSDSHFYEALETKQFVTLKDVKEWLMQKRQESITDLLQTYPKNHPFRLFYQAVIDELLEELNQP